jgi:hypothetical protein
VLRVWGTHCIAPAGVSDAPQPALPGVTVAPNTTVWSVGEQFAVDSVYVYPGYVERATPDTKDVALLHLSRPVPAARCVRACVRARKVYRYRVCGMREVCLAYARPVFVCSYACTFVRLFPRV